MKKYITIAMLLAAGSALANAAETVVFDFGRTDDESFKTAGAICIGTNGERYQASLSASGTLGTINGTYSFAQAVCTNGSYGNSATLNSGEEANWKEHLKGDLPEGWGSTFADGLTCQHIDTDAFTLTFSKLDAGYYDLSVLGGYYGNDNIVPSVTLVLGGVVCTETAWSADDLGGSGVASASGVSSLDLSMANGSGNEGYLFDVTKVLVEKGNTLTITIKGNTTDVDQRTPLNGLKLSFVAAIPEPSTFGLLAGLGALALVGTRRRRR
ncbi:MAG: PEP-CTERM sorting domain-containing protein [Opitutales bacterium]|nr:PEP-CTERM sorting domain-containing protein [Opitutales bacterium]